MNNFEELEVKLNKVKIEENKKKCRITCDDNIDCIGTKAILKLEVRSDSGTSTTYTKEIIVKGLF